MTLWNSHPRLLLGAVLLGASLLSCTGPQAGEEPLDVVEATIPEMQQAMEEGRITSRERVEAHLLRTALYEERANAVMALKDNVHTTFIPTTGGALVFDGFVPPYDATLTQNLVDAGAIILAKTVMTELANFMASGMPGNYSAVGGYGLNPYDPRRDPREGRNDGRPVLGVGGSSSGIGTAMSFRAANVGTETSGSILSPSNANMLAAVKPTVGRVSRYGVIPITADQDIAGLMAEAIEILRAQGATIVDPADIPSILDPDPERNLLLGGRSSVLSYGLKRDFNAWLASLGESAPVKTMTELMEWNLAPEGAGAMKVRQARLDGGDALDLEGDCAQYEADRAQDLFLNGEHGIDEVMTNMELDALLFPGSSSAGIAAKPGYPTVMVPFGFVETDSEGMPDGFDPNPVFSG